MSVSLHDSIEQSIDTELMFEFDNYYYTLTIRHKPDVFPESQYLLKTEELNDLIFSQLSEGKQWTEDTYANVFSYDGNVFTVKTIVLQLVVFHGTPSSFFQWEEIGFNNGQEVNPLKNLQPFQGFLESKKSHQNKWKN